MDDHEEQAIREYHDNAWRQDEESGEHTRTLESISDPTMIIIRKVGDKEYIPIVRYRGGNEDEYACAEPSSLENAKENAWRYFRGCFLYDAAKPVARVETDIT